VQGKYEKKFISISIGLLHLIKQSEIVYPKKPSEFFDCEKDMSGKVYFYESSLPEGWPL
jgi:hypothetical protein